MAQTILITGVAGFLGRYIAREFSRGGWRVVGVDVVEHEFAPGEAVYSKLSLPSPELDDLVADAMPDACVHCAGRASVPLSMTDPGSDFRDGAALTFELLDTLRRFAPRCRTVLLSSAAVYGNPRQLPVDEAQLTAPLSPYGYHKVMCELQAEEFARIFGLPTASIRIFSAYGPGLRRQVVWDMCERVLKQSHLNLRGTGRETRDFIHAADVARAIAYVVERGAFEGERYNVATGRETTIAELAELILKHLGSAIEPVFDGAESPGDPLNWRADISRLAALGFAPEISLEAGTQAVAEWAVRELMPQP